MELQDIRHLRGLVEDTHVEDFVSRQVKTTVQTVADFNNVTGLQYTKEQIREYTPVREDDEAAKNAVIESMDVDFYIETKFNETKHKIDYLLTASQNLTEEVQRTAILLQRSVADDLQLIRVYSSNVTTAAECQFLGNDYRNAKVKLCSDSVSGLITLSNVAMVLVICNAIIGTLAVIASKNFKTGINKYQQIQQDRM